MRGVVGRARDRQDRQPRGGPVPEKYSSVAWWVWILHPRFHVLVLASLVSFNFPYDNLTYRLSATV